MNIRKILNNISVMSANWGERMDYSTGKTYLDKEIKVINHKTGIVETYKLEDSYNRINSVKEDNENEYYQKMSDFEVMNEYVKECLACNGYKNAGVIIDSLENEIEREVNRRVQAKLIDLGVDLDKILK